MRDLENTAVSTPRQTPRGVAGGALDQAVGASAARVAALLDWDCGRQPPRSSRSRMAPVSMYTSVGVG